MFTIQSAVTVVTAGLASKLFGITSDIVTWSVIITIFCSVILILGKYQWLDKFIKVIMISLAISSILAVGVALFNNDSPSFEQVLPEGSGLLFLIAFLGWMPSTVKIGKKEIKEISLTFLNLR